MNDDRLKEELARQVLGWKVAPDRLIKSGRSWIPTWRFSPLEKIEDACQLLDAAAPTYYTISFSAGCFKAEVEIRGNLGKATGASRPRTLVLALARSLGLDVQT